LLEYNKIPGKPKKLFVCSPRVWPPRLLASQEQGIDAIKLRLVE
jgi:hypothetical protein